MISELGHKMLSLVESYRSGYLAHFEFLEEMAKIVKSDSSLDTSIAAMKICEAVVDSVVTLNAKGEL